MDKIKLPTCAGTCSIARIQVNTIDPPTTKVIVPVVITVSVNNLGKSEIFVSRYNVLAWFYCHYEVFGQYYFWVQRYQQPPSLIIAGFDDLSTKSMGIVKIEVAAAAP